MRTQVAIIGAGPAGLVLGRLLSAAGVESVILEARDRTYVEQRVRAGLLEPGTVDVLAQCGVGGRLHREGMPQDRFDLRFNGRSHRVEVAELTGRRMTVYGQSEVVKDLIAARLDERAPLLFEAEDVRLHDVDSASPHVTFRHDGGEQRLDCDFVAGCDGFHGVSRSAIAPDRLRVVEHLYPFSWLGILAQIAPPANELVYTRHDDGLALLTLRTPERTRLYIQCAADDQLENWPEERIWQTLRQRLATDDGFELRDGPVLEKGFTHLRSFVAEPMQYGRLFLAGDAAHIVPPAGAKGLNLAIADVKALGAALTSFFASGDETLLGSYSATCLRRVWQTQRFSWFMTSLLHRFPGADEFERRLQVAQLEQIVTSPETQMSFVNSYLGVYPG
jgi:p-hydroxybenzoate 3-monooxygenase